MKKKIFGILIVMMLVILSSLSLNAMGLKTYKKIDNSKFGDDWPPTVKVQGSFLCLEEIIGENIELKIDFFIGIFNVPMVDLIGLNGWAIGVEISYLDN